MDSSTVGCTSAMVAIFDCSSRDWHLTDMHNEIWDTEPAIGRAGVSPMTLSGRKRHGELMSLYVVGVGRKQSTRRMREELQPDRERRRALEQGRPFFWRQVGDGLKVQ